MFFFYTTWGSIGNFLLAIFPLFPMIIIWVNNYFEEKKIIYWLFLILANVLWMIYCTIVFFLVNNMVVGTGMLLIIIDNIVSIGIAIRGLIRRVKHEQTTSK